jgi:hypothetical protein
VPGIEPGPGTLTIRPQRLSRLPDIFITNKLLIEGYRKHGNEAPAFIKIEQVRDCHLLKKESAPLS